MKATIFYSWQSDLPSEIGRALIEDALASAIARIAEDATLVVRPELDHDTLGIPGAPSVIAAILRKIDECSVFVGDVTPTFARRIDGPQRLSPNPNVLIELGYALKRLGRERILLVLNEDYGEPEQLPFDLRGDRIIPFRLDSKQSLVEKLHTALHLIISKSGLPPDLLPPAEIRFKRINQVIEKRRHEYRLSAIVKNTGDEILADWSIEASFPRRVILPRSFGSLSQQNRDTHTILRQTQANHSGPLFPGEERELIGIDYYMDTEIYHTSGDLFEKDVVVTLYAGTHRIARHAEKFGNLQDF